MSSDVFGVEPSLITYPKEYLKNYQKSLHVPPPKGGFEHDIDVCHIAHIRHNPETGEPTHLYAISWTTEALYVIYAEEFTQISTCLQEGKEIPYGVFNKSLVKPVATEKTKEHGAAEQEEVAGKKKLLPKKETA